MVHPSCLANILIHLSFFFQLRKSFTCSFYKNSNQLLFLLNFFLCFVALKFTLNLFSLLFYLTWNESSSIRAFTLVQVKCWVKALPMTTCIATSSNKQVVNTKDTWFTSSRLHPWEPTPHAVGKKSCKNHLSQMWNWPRREGSFLGTNSSPQISKLR